MTVSVELVAKVFEDRDLDRIEVWDQAKRMLLSDADGKAECLALLQELPTMVDGVFRVVGSSRSSKDKKTYEWVCEGEADGGGAVGVVAAGPSWERLLDVQLQLQELKLRQELANPAADPMAQLLELFDRVSAAPAPPTPAAPAAPAPAALAPGELAPEVLAACRQVAIIARDQPDLFKQYAPILAQAAGEPLTDG